MKETTRIITAEITLIKRHEGDIPALAAEDYAKQLQVALDADDVKVINVQDFTRDEA